MYEAQPIWNKQAIWHVKDSDMQFFSDQFLRLDQFSEPRSHWHALYLGATTQCCLCVHVDMVCLERLCSDFFDDKKLFNCCVFFPETRTICLMEKERIIMSKKIKIYHQKLSRRLYTILPERIYKERPNFVLGFSQLFVSHLSFFCNCFFFCQQGPGLCAHVALFFCQTNK